jgi:hypothetical protein
MRAGCGGAGGGASRIWAGLERMDAHSPEPAATLADVRRVDRWARMHAAELTQELELDLN